MSKKKKAKKKSKKKKVKKKTTVKKFPTVCPLNSPSVVVWHDLEPTEKQWEKVYDEHIMDCCTPEH